MVDQQKPTVGDQINGNHIVLQTNVVVKSQDQQGRKMLNQYTIHGKLGEGAFAQVKKVTNQQGHPFAVKVFKKQMLRQKKEYVKKKTGIGMEIRDQLMKVTKEVKAMRYFDHDNVVRLHEIIDDQEGDKLYLVMDYADKKEVQDWDNKQDKFVPSYQEEEIKQILRDCIEGLDYLHGLGVVHRDIKPQNIFLTSDGHAKLGDFSVAAYFGPQWKQFDNMNGDQLEETDRQTKTEGTYQFMAPEMCDPNINEFSGIKADIWALGVSLFCMIYDQLPYQGDNEFHIMENIRLNPVQLREREISEELKSILLSMLDKDNTNRVSLQQLKQNKWLFN